MTDALNVFPNKIHSSEDLNIDPDKIKSFNNMLNRQAVETEFNDEDLELNTSGSSPAKTSSRISPVIKSIEEYQRIFRSSD